MSRAEEYTSRVDLAGHDDCELCRIIEQAAFDDEITNEEYCEIYGHALSALKEADPLYSIISL